MSRELSYAEAYEGYMGRWSRKLAGPFIDFLGLRDDERLLDVGCGTGSLALSVAGLTNRGQVAGIDLTPAFVEYARSRVKGPRVTFDIGDALELPYPDESFDKCVSLLVLRFIKDVPRAVAEMRRVTRSGGIVAACVWDKDGMEMTSMFWRSAAELDPAADRRRETQSYGRGQLASLWAASGFECVEEKEIVIALEFESLDDLWTPLLACQGPSSSYILGLPPASQGALRARLREKVIGTGADQPFKLRGVAWAVRGIR